jgi:hypothetical protein
VEAASAGYRYIGDRHDCPLRIETFDSSGRSLFTNSLRRVTKAACAGNASKDPYP